MSKNVLVTGGNSGIGLALCKLLIKEHSCYVFLGARNLAKGNDAVKSILEEVPDKSDKIEVLLIDVGEYEWIFQYSYWWIMLEKRVCL